MIFLCGLFVPIHSLPLWLRPLSYIFPLTYGADLLHKSIHGAGALPAALDFGSLAAFCALLFGVSLRNVRRKWIS
jgi:ABC-2 type transport system permease protein